MFLNRLKQMVITAFMTIPFVLLFLNLVEAGPQVPSSPSPTPTIVLQTGIARANLLDAVAFSPNGHWLATSDRQSGDIKVWDAETGLEVRTFLGQNDISWTLAISPDGLIASIGRKALRILEASTGRQVREINIAGTSGINAVAFAKHGSWVSAASDDKTVKIWEVATGREVLALGGYSSGVASLAFSPAGNLLATGDIEHRLRLWNLVTKTNTAFTGHEDVVRSLAFSRDGAMLASGSSDHSLRLWSVADREEIAVLGAHDHEVGATAFSPNGRLIACATNGMIELWDMQSKRLVRTFSNSTNPVDEAFLGMSVPSHPGIAVTRLEMEGLAFSPNGDQIASTTLHSLKTWDIASGSIIRDFGQSSFRLVTAGFTPNGSALCLEEFVPGFPNTRVESILRWDLNGDRVPFADDAVAWPTEGMASELQGHCVALSDQSRTRLIEARTGHKLLLGQEEVPILRWFSPSGKWMAAPGVAGEGVVVWELSSGRKLKVLGKDEERIALGNPDLNPKLGTLGPDAQLQVVFSADETRLAFTWGNDIHVFDTSTWKEIVTLGNPHVVNHLTFSVPINGLPQEIHRSTSDSIVASLTFSPSGHFLVAGILNQSDKLINSEQPSWRLQKGQARIWETERWRKISTFEVPASIFPSLIVPSFSPDEAFIGFDNSRTGTFEVFEVKSGHETRSTMHPLYGPGFSATKGLQVSGRGLLDLWDLASERIVAQLALLNRGSDWVVVSPNGLFDGTPGAFRNLLWRFSDSTFETAPAEIFFNEFYHPGLLSELYLKKNPVPPTNISQVDRRQPTIKIELSRDLSGSDQPISVQNVTLRVTEASPDERHSLGSGARDVRLFRNGSLVRRWHNSVLSDRQNAATLGAAVRIVAGQNHLTAYAFNRDNIKSLDAELVVTGAESLNRKGTAYILAIGIDNYSNPDYDLRYAGADATAFAEELKRQQTRLGSFERVEVISLLDSLATKANILAALARLSGSETASGPGGAPDILMKMRTAEPEDAIFIYFAGHGTVVKNQFYLIPYDLGYQGGRTELDKNGLNSILAHSISDRDLEQALENVDAGKLVLVIDACNSGQALEAEEKRRGPMNSKGLAQLAYEKGMYILAATQSYQAALEASQLGHGLLTYTLVEEGLKTTAADTSPKDGQVELREWLDYAAQRVPQLQEKVMMDAHKSGRDVAFVADEQTIDVAKRSLQNPRVFYRREPETQLFIVAKF